MKQNERPYDITVKWDGTNLVTVISWPLTQDQYNGLKVSPNSVAHLMCKNVAEDLLCNDSIRVEIEEREAA